jgi:branched-chain amino acid transport system permease protein
MEILAGSVVAGLLIGMLFALIALGLTIIFGMMNIVNFAHGEFLMLGMYTTLLTSQATGLDPLMMIPVAGAVGYLLGFPVITASLSFFCAVRWWLNCWAPSV